jgi:hypothetical protein
LTKVEIIGMMIKIGGLELVKYSKKLYKKIEIIQEYYKKNNDSWIFQKIIKIFIDTIDLIDEKYIVLPKVYLTNYLIDVNDIWDKDGNSNKLDEVKISFLEDFNKIKERKKISENDKIDIALNCFLRLLHNWYKNKKNIYDILKLHIEDLALLDVDEKHINYLLGKYFMGIL